MITRTTTQPAGMTALQLARQLDTVRGTSGTLAEQAAAAGSSRHYWRLTAPDGFTAIGATGTVKAENEAFLRMASALRQAGVSVPEVLWTAPDSMSYIVSDGGCRSLFDHIMADRHTGDGSLSRATMELCFKAVSQLAQLQTAGVRVVDPAWCYPVAKMSRQAVMWDLNYFKYCFLKPALDDIDEVAIEREFDVMASAATATGLLTGLQYRDFQSRNVMTDRDGRVTLIDFQGARRGMLLYDLASMLWQVKARFRPGERIEIIDVYRAGLSSRLDVAQRITDDEFDRQLRLAVVLRQLQTLGAYGFRGLVQGKPHFVTSIDAALEAATDPAGPLAGSMPSVYAALTAVGERRRSRAVTATTSGATAAEGLTVTVTSFSFKRGYPADNSGNGGGFVFDCRGMHNPGRYERYRNLTGRDRPVVDFLRERGECDAFVDDAIRLTAPTVETYMRRGFTSLCVSFGCTGGQHRSVYCAEHYASRLQRLYPAATVLTLHREHPESPSEPC